MNGKAILAKTVGLILMTFLLIGHVETQATATPPPIPTNTPFPTHTPAATPTPTKALRAAPSNPLKDFLKEVTLADWIVAVLSLLFSMVVFVVNYRHTDRKFHDTSYPMPRVHVLEAASKYGILIGVHNLHKNTPMTEVRLSVEIAQDKPEKTLSRLLQEWHHITDISQDIIYPYPSPNDSKSSQIPDLAKFIHENLPSVLERFVEKHKGRTESNYKVLRDTPLRLRITVIYRPGVYHEKTCKKTYEFELSPTSSQGVLTGWNVIEPWREDSLPMDFEDLLHFG